MTLIIEHAPTFSQERAYIFEILLRDFLGIDFCQKEKEELTHIRITRSDQPGEINLPDILFQYTPKQWLSSETLPQGPLKKYEVPSTLSAKLLQRQVPVLYGIASDESKKSFSLPIDIFGSCFYLLSMYEEVAKNERDQHDRFSALTSLAYQENFIERPLVNEYLEILWSTIQRTFPQMKRKEKEFRVVLSCDVDVPFKDELKSNALTIKNVVADIVKRKSVSTAIQTLKESYQIRKYGLEYDPYYTFDWLMDACEKANVKNEFYFICDHTCALDGNYSLQDHRILNLLKTIHSRGHTIGLHGSYGTYENHEQLQKEFDILKGTCKQLGIQQAHWGGRQHYLRWKAPQTWRVWEHAGLDYDSTVGFADHVGFRTGCCYPYFPFDLLERRKLKIIEIPLIVMECTLGRPEYMGIGYNEAMAERVLSLKQTCQRFNGDFSLLWHNSAFITSEQERLFEHILQH